jgi:hypothetical protein
VKDLISRVRQIKSLKAERQKDAKEDFDHTNGAVGQSEPLFGFSG